MRAGIDQRTGFRSRSSKLVQYVGVVGFALAGIAFGLTAVVKAATGTAQRTQRERTLLDVRMESDREIRQALAKPIPHPTPLPPMTTRVTRPIGPTVAASNRDHAQLMDVARDAFANIEPVDSTDGRNMMQIMTSPEDSQWRKWEGLGYRRSRRTSFGRVGRQANR